MSTYNKLSRISVFSGDISGCAGVGLLSTARIRVTYYKGKLTIYTTKRFLYSSITGECCRPNIRPQNQTDLATPYFPSEDISRKTNPNNW